MKIKKIKSCILPVAFVLLMISSVNAQRKDTSDYFSIGIFAGKYDPVSMMRGSGVVNSTGLEIEYYKFTDLSFFVQGLYKFSNGNGYRRPVPVPVEDGPSPLSMNNDRSQILGVYFGGKYYLRSQNINPFFELGLNQEFRVGGGGRPPHPPEVAFDNIIPFDHNVEQINSYNMSLGIGTGVSFKLDPQFKLEAKYNLYRTFTRNGGTGYSLLISGKFNL